MSDNDLPIKTKKKSGIPTGNAGEYFVMGELLRRGFDAQLADRNTQDYDVLVGKPEEPVLHKVQIKTVRSAPWYVKSSDFEGALLDQITIYVLIGDSKAAVPVRYFLARNRELAGNLHRPSGWAGSAFMPLKAVTRHEGRWELLNTLGAPATQPFPDKFVGDAEDWSYMGDNMWVGEEKIYQPDEVPNYGAPPTPPVNASRDGKPKRAQKPGRTKS